LTQNEETALTICEVFVGDLEDPTFKWDDVHQNGNIPARLSPIFPPLPGNYNRTYEDWVATTGVKSKQTDFSGQVARVTKSQIEQFVASAYRDDDRSRHSESFAELAQAIAALDDHRIYGLVATEW
jgi:hypothetical protein